MAYKQNFLGFWCPSSRIRVLQSKNIVSASLAHISINFILLSFVPCPVSCVERTMHLRGWGTCGNTHSSSPLHPCLWTHTHTHTHTQTHNKTEITRPSQLIHPCLCTLTHMNTHRYIHWQQTWNFKTNNTCITFSVKQMSFG